MGWAGAAAAALGAVSSGIGIFGRSRQQKQQNSLVDQSLRSQFLATQQATADYQRQAATLKNDIATSNAQAEQRRLKASMLLGSMGKPNILKGIDTIKTSPLGLLDEPNLASSRLLGN